MNNKRPVFVATFGVILAVGILYLIPSIAPTVYAQEYSNNYDSNQYNQEPIYNDYYDPKDEYVVLERAHPAQYYDQKNYDNGYLDKNNKPKIFPANKVSQLGDRWWQWGFGLDASIVDPFTNIGQAGCDVGLQDNGKLLFLVGTAKDPDTGFPVHECDIKKGTSILFPIVNVACNDLDAPPFFGANEQEQRQCSNSFIDTALLEDFVVKIDGYSVKNLEQYRIDSPAGGFEFTAVENNPFATPVGDGTGVSDGYWILLAPLKPGKHTIEFMGVLDLTEIFQTPEPFIFEVGATYNLNVKSGYY
ncbi:MAG: hypothetical protein ACE5SW_11710 [Nitrososphaeraceae archaeon]